MFNICVAEENLEEEPIVKSVFDYRFKSNSTLSGVFKGRLAKHLPRPPLFWGPLKVLRP